MPLTEIKTVENSNTDWEFLDWFVQKGSFTVPDVTVRSSASFGIDILQIYQLNRLSGPQNLETSRDSYVRIYIPVVWAYITVYFNGEYFSLQMCTFGIYGPSGQNELSIRPETIL